MRVPFSKDKKNTMNAFCDLNTGCCSQGYQLQNSFESQHLMSMVR